MKPFRLVLVASLVALQVGCHTMRFEVAPGPHEKVVHHRKSFWVGALFPEVRVDVSQYCPAGVVAVEEETTFLDGFFGFITLSIWTPRTSRYYCRPEQVSP